MTQRPCPSIHRSARRRITPFIQFLSALPLACGCATSPPFHPDLNVSTENLQTTVRYLSGLTPPRNLAHPESLQKASACIFQSLAASGLSPEYQCFTVGGRPFANVLASLAPGKPHRLVVGAHYDVCGNTPGADDNASAVAGLLEIARLLKPFETNLPHRVDLVAYTLEEPPTFGTPDMGSHHHAGFLHDTQASVRGMICLEMIGFYSRAPRSQSYPLSLLRLFHPDTGDFIGVIGNYASSGLGRHVARHLAATGVGVERLSAPGWLQGVDFSDHRNYWKFGFDAVMITDTAFFRNPNYHRPTDTLDTLDFHKMAEVVKGISWALLNPE